MATNSISPKQNTVYLLNPKEHVLNHSPELLQLILPHLKNTQDLLSAKEVNRHWYKNVVVIVAQKQSVLIQRFQATLMPKIKDQALVKKMHSTCENFQTQTSSFKTFGDLKIALETLKKDLLVSFRHLRESSPQTLKTAQFKMPCFLNYHLINLALFWDYVDQAKAITDEQERNEFLFVVLDKARKIENFDLLLCAEVAHSLTDETHHKHSILKWIAQTLAKNFDLQKAVQVANSHPHLKNEYFWWIAYGLVKHKNFDTQKILEITDSLSDEISKRNVKIFIIRRLCHPHYSKFQEAIEIANSIPCKKTRLSLLQEIRKQKWKVLGDKKFTQ